MTFTELVQKRRILICVGAGGVGKTTTAAALALGAARAGRRTLVLTIDPAKRLANSLGLRELDHEERLVPPEKVGPGDGVEPGTLHAMMLDQKRAFDEIVERYTPDPAARQRIFKNRIYQQISSTLTGSHEYAAMATLYSIARQDRFDLIVLDTPPTANALDFLDAPDKITDAIDSPAMQWLLKPYLESGRFSMKLVGLGGAFVLKRLARFVGSQFLEDMAAFLAEFNAVLGGLRERAREVFDLLRRPDCGFVLVCSPDPLTVDEAVSFEGRLREMQLPLGGFVINRVHPPGPSAPDRQTLIDLLEAREELRGFSADELVQVAADLDRTYRDFQALAEIDARQAERIRAVSAEAPFVEVPLFDHDIYDVDGLTLIDKYLLG